MLSGHFDVVEPMPDHSEFVPRIDGDYLWGRGSADMKTVVASYMVWMKDLMKASGVLPAINLLLVGNEENGEMEPLALHMSSMYSSESTATRRSCSLRVSVQVKRNRAIR